MKATDLHARDERTRKKLWGRHSIAFISPVFPVPKTDGEKIALKLLSPNTYMLHVYDVAELIETAFNLGVKASPKRNR